MSCCSDIPLPEKPSCSTGTLEALKLMISGGSVPGGSDRSMNSEAAPTCAFAVSRLAFGWRKIFTTTAAAVGRRFDVLDVVDQRRQRLLVGRGQPALELLRIQPRVLPGHRDHRDIDARKDIRRRAQDHHRREDENQQRQDDEGVRAIERESYDPHGTGNVDALAEDDKSGQEDALAVWTGLLQGAGVDGTAPMEGTAPSVRGGCGGAELACIRRVEWRWREFCLRGSQLAEAPGSDRAREFRYIMLQNCGVFTGRSGEVCALRSAVGRGPESAAGRCAGMKTSDPTVSGRIVAFRRRSRNCRAEFCTLCNTVSK